MKRFFELVFLLLSMTFISGCASSAYMTMQQGYPASVSPALVYTDDVVYPSKDSFTMFTLNRSDYRLLGHVSTEMESKNILYVYAEGDNGYGKLMEVARRKYPQTNALMNVYWDSKIQTIGWPYPPIPLFQKVTARVTATAVEIR